MLIINFYNNPNSPSTTTTMTPSTTTTTTMAPSTTTTTMAPSTTTTTTMAPSTTTMAPSTTTMAPSTTTTMAPSTTTMAPSTTTMAPSTTTKQIIPTETLSLINKYYLIDNFTNVSITSFNTTLNLTIKNIYKLNNIYYALLSDFKIYKSATSSTSSTSSTSFPSFSNLSWTQISPNSYDTNMTFNFFLFANNTLFVFGNLLSYSSSNGVGWNLIQDRSINNISNASNKKVYICYDNNMYYLLINNSIYKKPFDYIYWYKIFTSANDYDNISAGNNRLILSYRNEILFSENYLTFSSSSYNYPNITSGNVNPVSINKFIFINGLFIGINNGPLNLPTPLGGILYSADGNNWIDNTESKTILYNCITYDSANNIIIAFGQNYNTNQSKITIGTFNSNNITFVHYNFDKNITDLVLK